MPLVASTDAVAVAVSVVATLVVVAVAASALYLLHTARALRRECEQLRAEADALMDELAETVRRAGAEVDRVDRMVGSAAAISEALGSASRLVGGAVAEPVIKVAAFASGVARIVQVLRHPRGHVPVPAISHERPSRRGRAGASRKRTTARHARALPRAR